MELFGNILLEQDNNIDFENIEKILKRPVIKPRYKISVLNPDESVNYVIPNTDITLDGISYTENYQNGQRKSVTLKLINKDGKYTPSINGIWMSTKFRLDVGIAYKTQTIWFPKGIYVMGNVSLAHSSTEEYISISLKDKYAIFEDKMGTLEDAYEVELDSDIAEVVQGILNFSLGNGYIMDYKPPIFDSSFAGKKTQSTIRIEEGGSLSQVIDALATQLSAEYYYNNVGNLCFYPINETVDDSAKPVIWTFEKMNRELHNISLNYKNEDIINVVKVVGDSVDDKIYSAIVTNENITSPICIQQIGRRAAPKYTESSVWSDDLAYDMANYYLRQHSFVSVDFSCEVGFNPILSVNNICEVENDFVGMKREKLLITSISFSSSDGSMSLTMCNTSDLPQNTKKEV